MYNKEELQMIVTFMNLEQNLDNTVLHVKSRKSPNRWMIVDYTDKFKERYGVYVCAKGRGRYRNFNQCKSLQEVLRSISAYETKKK